MPRMPTTRAATSAASAGRPVSRAAVGTRERLRVPMEEGTDFIAVDGTEPLVYASFWVRSRSALMMTLTDDSAIAAAAMTGDSSHPNTGYSTPAAIGMPAVL